MYMACLITHAIVLHLEANCAMKLLHICADPADMRTIAVSVMRINKKAPTILRMD